MAYNRLLVRARNPAFFSSSFGPALIAASLTLSHTGVARHIILSRVAHATCFRILSYLFSPAPSTCLSFPLLSLSGPSDICAFDLPPSFPCKTCLYHCTCSPVNPSPLLTVIYFGLLRNWQLWFEPVQCPVPYNVAPSEGMLAQTGRIPQGGGSFRPYNHALRTYVGSHILAKLLLLFLYLLLLSLTPYTVLPFPPSSHTHQLTKGQQALLGLTPWGR